MLIMIDISNKELHTLNRFYKEYLNMASQWLTDTLALISTVAAGSASNPATTAAVAQLTTRMNAQDVTDAEFEQAITALVKALAAAPPATGAASPIVTSLSPATGPVAGGNTVTLTGSGFTAASKVLFGTVTATSFTVVNDTTITAVPPALAAGVSDVTVVTPVGTSATSASDQYTAA
jgi:hypothetical protein